MRPGTLDIMSEPELTSPPSSSDSIEVDFGGSELLPSVQPLWEALSASHAAGTSNGLPTQSARDSWPLRFARYERIFEREDAFMLVARQGTKAVGYAVAYADDPFDDESESPIVMIESLAVLPELRSQGLGGWLLEEVEGEAIELWGATESAVEVPLGNEAAEGFAARAGFVEFGETWLRPAPQGTPAEQAGSASIDDDRLGILLEEGSELFAVGLEEGPDDTWITSEVLVLCQPEPGFAADGPSLEAMLAPFAAAGATSALVALDATSAPGWGEALTTLGFRQVLRLFTRTIAVE